MVFKKGGLGGPGRGKKKKSKVNEIDIADKDLFELLEIAVRKGLVSNDMNEALIAARAAINLQKLKGPPDKGKSLISPVLAEMVGKAGGAGIRESDNIVDEDEVYNEFDD
jgi:hypothetical protein